MTGLPQYDFKTHTRLPMISIFQPAPLVLVEGLWVLHEPKLRSWFSLKIFLDCPESPADLRGSLDSQLRYFGAHGYCHLGCGRVARLPCSAPVLRPRMGQGQRRVAFENVATTEPLIMGDPQSSTTRTFTGAGQLAGAAKLSDSDVIRGASSIGVQAPSAGRANFGAADVPGATTNSRLTARVTPPENCSVNALDTPRAAILQGPAEPRFA